MTRRPPMWLAAAVLLCVLGIANSAEARRSGFVTGETIEYIGTAKGPIAQQAQAELGGGSVELGFFYSYVGIGPALVWTWGGSFVLYNSAVGNVKHYIAITDEQAKAANGDTMPGKPFLYRVPVGLILFPLMIGIALLSWFVIRPLKSRRREKQLDKLASDSRYVHALQMTEPVEHRDDDGDVFTAPKHSTLDAVDWLTTQGIPRDEARSNYAALADRRDALSE